MSLLWVSGDYKHRYDSVFCGTNTPLAQFHLQISNLLCGLWHWFLPAISKLLKALATDNLCLQGLTWPEFFWPALFLWNYPVFALRLLVSSLTFSDLCVCFCCSWDPAYLLIQRDVIYKSSHPGMFLFFSLFWTTSCFTLYLVALAIFQWAVLDFNPASWFNRNTNIFFKIGSF